jgi:hypothetical protein
MLTLPQPGTRITLSVVDPPDEKTGRQIFHHYVGHVIKWTASSPHPQIQEITLVLQRDSSADGRRPSEILCIPASQIRFLKPVPERKPFPRKRESGTQKANN